MFKTVAQLIRKFTSSLSFKLSFYAALIMVLALLVFSYHSISTQEENLVNRMVQGALKDSEVIKAAIWNGMMANDRKVINEIINTVGSQVDFEEINVFDLTGRLCFTSNPGTPEQGERPSTDPLFKDVETDTSWRFRHTRDGKSIRVVNPILNSKSCSSASCHAHPESEKVLGLLEVKLGLSGVNRELFKSKQNTIVFAAVLFLLVSTISGLAVVFLVNPGIRRLQRRAARMAKGQYRPEGSTTGLDEMAQLSRAFDQMSRKVNERTQDLDRRRKMYKALFNEAPCYFTVVSRDYRIVRANRTFQDAFGDQVGRHCYTGYKGLDSRCENCPVEKTFADGRSHQSEEIWRLDGKNAYVLVKTSPILDPGGHITEVLEMSIDVTRLKQLQIDFEKKQQEYKYLFDNAPCYLTVVDREFNIVQTNRLFENDFGGHTAKKCYQVYKQRDSKCDNCPVEKTFLDGQTHNSEETWRRAGEDTHIIVYTAPVMDAQGYITAVMEMSTNITEVKRLQSQLVTLGETIAGMSHTVKNILCGLQGGVYVIDSGLTRGKEDRVRAGWSMVKNNVEKVSELVQGILYASKEREPEYQPCDPAKVLSEVCDLYEGKARSEGVQLVRAFDPIIGLYMLDPAGIHSALSNLVSNAIEACRRGEARDDRTVKIGGCAEAGTLFLQVSDDGIGMSEEVKEKLFNRFYSTKGSKGTGLGLVITRKVVEEHGGTIHVESKPGKGTTFTIEIPVQSAGQGDAIRAAV